MFLNLSLCLQTYIYIYSEDLYLILNGDFMAIASEYFDPNKSQMKEIDIILDENDDILDCIKLSMKENNIMMADIVLFEGEVINFSVNYFERGSLKNVKFFEPHTITKGIGQFKYDYIKDSIFGRVRIIYLHKEKTFDGILMSGKAKDGFKITLSYLEQKE
jgi:hypothetical protein